MTSECVSVADAIFTGCRNAFFQPQCPEKDVSTTHIEGSLVVREDRVQGGGGGEFTVEGLCDTPSCRQDGRHQFLVDSTGVLVQSAGGISIESANSNYHHGKGADLVLKSGNGTTPSGGYATGGEIFIRCILIL